MAGTLLKVRFKRAWGNYRVGDEITPNGTLRDFLVNNGWAEVVEAESGGRPAKIAGKAARKLASAAAGLFKQ